jgi:hypothetical protein
MSFMYSAECLLTGNLKILDQWHNLNPPYPLAKRQVVLGVSGVVSTLVNSAQIMGPPIFVFVIEKRIREHLDHGLNIAQINKYKKYS